MIHMTIKEFMNRDYEAWCVDGSENYTWLDITFLVLFALWLGEKV